MKWPTTRPVRRSSLEQSWKPWRKLYYQKCFLANARPD